VRSPASDSKLYVLTDVEAVQQLTRRVQINTTAYGQLLY